MSTRRTKRASPPPPASSPHPRLGKRTKEEEEADTIMNESNEFNTTPESADTDGGNKSGGDDRGEAAVPVISLSEKDNDLVDLTDAELLAACAHVGGHDDAFDITKTGETISLKKPKRKVRSRRLCFKLLVV